MDNQEAIYLGVVMAWEPQPTPDGGEPFRGSLPVVTEFCPGQLCAGHIQATSRMTDLAIAGFMPVAIVYCDPGNDSCYFLYEHNGVSDRVHQHLVAEAKAIFHAAAGSQSVRVMGSPEGESTPSPGQSVGGGA